MLYPIGIQNFEKLREGKFTYIDKTNLIYDLVHSGTYYFLSRPRRFGKSLLISTMEAYFMGKKELFKGLAIEQLEKEWIEYPVLHLDLSGIDYRQQKNLDVTLDQHLRIWEQEYGISARYDIPAARFKDIFDAAYAKTGKQVVVLIDEYDKPIVDNLDNKELWESFRSTLQGFYSVLKAKDGQIRFAFLAGVTKIGKMSVFSGLNNLNDISMTAEYADICGISEDDLRGTFDESVEELAATNGMTKDECYAKLKEMYDGYHFCEDSIGVYNPFSLLNTFKANKFRDYWFETGTPTFLAKALRDGYFNLDKIEGTSMDAASLSRVSGDFSDTVSVLYQAGYLTIKDFDPEFGDYLLGYPNREVEIGFLKCLSAYFTPMEKNRTEFSVKNFVTDVRNGDVEGFMNRLSAFFADNDYTQGNAELYFQNTLHVLLKLMGMYVEVERHTSNGRIDLLMKTDKYIYIFELKLDIDAETALKQINDKGYDAPFKADGRKIFKIGVNFSSGTRRIENWIAE